MYNLTFGIQQDIGFGTVLDASYVTTLGRRLGQYREINTLPYGVRFLPQNADPTSPGKPLSDNFLVPMPGYSTIRYIENAGSSNYHGLLVSANRRFIKGVQIGVAYTFSKFMNYNGPGALSTQLPAAPVYRPLRVWSYGKDLSDQTHNLQINYSWDLPKASKRWANPVVRNVFDDWQISGITGFVSGQPNTISFTTTDSVDLTGGGDGQRVNVTGKAPLDHGQRTFLRWFNPTVFARPGKGDPGNAPKDVFRGPGVNNWDVSLVKRIPLKSESRSLQMRWEVYNLFNHTQFASVDSTARFDPQGNQVNARFGQVISTRLGRVMQVSLRFAF
jgi:hypothetical protein